MLGNCRLGKCRWESVAGKMSAGKMYQWETVGWEKVGTPIGQAIVLFTIAIVMELSFAAYYFFYASFLIVGSYYEWFQ